MIDPPRRQRSPLARLASSPRLVFRVATLFLVATLGVASGCTLGGSAGQSVSPEAGLQPAPSSEPFARFLALGDSYTIGESIEPEGRWPVQLAQMLRGEGVAAGEPEIVARTGWTTGELRQAMEERGLWSGEVSAPYDLVTLLIGVNDQYRGGDADSYRPAFRKLLERSIELVGGRKDRVVVLSIPNWGLTPFAGGRDREEITADIRAFNRVNREESRRAGVAWVDVTPIADRVPEEPTLTASDGLHPSAEQYRGWAEAALPAATAALRGAGAGAPHPKIH